MIRTFCQEELTIRVHSSYIAIEHALENNNPQEVADYLKALQDFSAYIVGYNKPCIIDFEGEVYNSAAASLLQMVHVNYHPGACAVFNEAKRGCTLLGGSSYVLSRMPKGVGKYLALTGAPITGSDLFHFKLATVQLNLDYETLKQIETEASKYPPFRQLSFLELMPPIKSMRMLHDDQIMFRQHERLAKELNAKLQARENPANALLELATKELLMDKAHMLELTTLANNWEKRLEDLKRYNLIHTVENRLGFFDDFVLDIVKKTQDEQTASIANDRGEISQNEGLIKSIFNTDNFDTIIKNLKSSKTAWAQKTLESLENIDPNVANRILQQIDYATHNDYVSCLVHEYNTAIKYFTDVTKVRFDPKQHEYKPSSPVKALLPVREYYREFPDAVRMTLNSSHNSCPYVAQNFGATTNVFLNLNGIDIINPVTDLDVAREVLWRRKSIQRDIALENEQRDDILDNYQMRSAFFEERRDAIERLTTHEDFNQTVQEAIADAFNKKLKVTREMIGHKFKGFQTLLRKDKLAKFRRCIIESALAPLASDYSKTSVAMFPMEIVEDPLAINQEVDDRYFITQRAELLQTTFKDSPVLIDEFMKGQITMYDLISIKPKDPSNVVLTTNDYFRDYIYEPNRKYFIRYQKLFLENLHRGNGEDPREVDFRESYIADQVKEIMSHLKIDKKHELKEYIESRLRDLLFDYLDGKESLFEYKDPHLSRKTEALDVKNSIDLFKLKTELRRDLKLDTNIAEKIMSLTDLNLENSKKDSHLTLDDSEKTEFDTYLISNIKENPFLEERLSLLFTDNQENPIIKNIINESKDHLNASFRQSLEKYNQLESSMVSFPELRGYYKDDASNKFMNQIDSFLNTSIKVDFFDMIATESIRHFSETMLDRLDSWFESAFDQIKGQKYLAHITKQVPPEFPKLKEEGFKQVLIKIGRTNKISGEMVDESVKFLDKWLFILAELQHEYKKGSYKSVDVLPKDDMDDEKMTEYLINKYTTTSTFKPLSLKKTKLSKIVARLVEERESKAKLLLPASTKQKELKEKMVACSQVDPSVENYEDVLRTYQSLKATHMDNLRGLVYSPSSLIIELETVIKRMREGKESGVYDDFSVLHKILHDSYTNLKDNPDSWIQNRVREIYIAHRLLRDLVRY